MTPTIAHLLVLVWLQITASNGSWNIISAPLTMTSQTPSSKILSSVTVTITCDTYSPFFTSKYVCGTQLYIDPLKCMTSSNQHICNVKEGWLGLPENDYCDKTDYPSVRSLFAMMQTFTINELVEVAFGDDRSYVVALVPPIELCLKGECALIPFIATVDLNNLQMLSNMSALCSGALVQTSTLYTGTQAQVYTSGVTIEVNLSTCSGLELLPNKIWLQKVTLNSFESVVVHASCGNITFMQNDEDNPVDIVVNS